MEDNKTKEENINTPKKKSNKYFSIGAVFFLVVFLLSAGYLVKENYILKSEKKFLKTKISKIEGKNLGLEKNILELKEKVDEITSLKQEMQRTFDLLETDIDTNNWTEYESDKYGYSLKLPENYVFLPEGSRDLIEFSPERTSFEVGTAEDKKWNYLFHFSVFDEDIDALIKQTGYEADNSGIYQKIISNNGIDFYLYQKLNDTKFISVILYRDSFGLQFSYDKGAYSEEEFWAVLNTVKLVN